MTQVARESPADHVRLRGEACDGGGIREVGLQGLEARRPGPCAFQRGGGAVGEEDGETGFAGEVGGHDRADHPASEDEDLGHGMSLLTLVPMSDRAVCLVSGGMDSAVTLAEARGQGFACHALSFDYGQRQAVELDAAARVARALGAVDHRVVGVDLSAFQGSALTLSLIHI